jgi:hypothetical protein
MVRTIRSTWILTSDADKISTDTARQHLTDKISTRHSQTAFNSEKPHDGRQAGNQTNIVENMFKEMTEMMFGDMNCLQCPLKLIEVQSSILIQIQIMK